MSDGRSRNLRRFVVFMMLFAFWLVFSGHFDTLHISLGVMCCTVVAALSYDLLLPDTLSSRSAMTAWRFLQYTPWLIYEVVVANFHVLALVLQPGRIRPQVVRFKTGLKSDLAKVTLANSITLTPGTITMDVDGDEFYVHAVSDEAAQSVMSDDMERRVAHVFFEPRDAARPAGEPDPDRPHERD
jgi:multicomponent Na+:H+ antiporter subunit E